MFIHTDGSIESGKWHTRDLYPDSYYIDENTSSGQVLATKATEYHPYVRYNVVNGEIVDVQRRDKTPEEIEQENAPKPKTEVELLQEQVAQLTAMLGDLILGGGI